MKTMQKNKSAQNVHNVQCATYRLRMAMAKENHGCETVAISAFDWRDLKELCCPIVVLFISKCSWLCSHHHVDSSEFWSLLTKWLHLFTFRCCYAATSELGRPTSKQTEKRPQIQRMKPQRCFVSIFLRLSFIHLLGWPRTGVTFSSLGQSTSPTWVHCSLELCYVQKKLPSRGPTPFGTFKN